MLLVVELNVDVLLVLFDVKVWQCDLYIVFVEVDVIVIFVDYVLFCWMDLVWLQIKVVIDMCGVFVCV